jgi:ornithine cyclodeaminase
MCTVRPIEQIRIFSRTREKAEALIVELSGTRNCAFIATASPQDALQGADIVCATTTSPVPVFDDVDLAPGVHINAVGSYMPQVREIPPETVARAVVVVDSRAAAWEEAGDLIQPLNAGLITRDHIRAELGELVLGTKPGRADGREITFFKSVGIAVQDAVAARVALENATNQGLGVTVAW